MIEMRPSTLSDVGSFVPKSIYDVEGAWDGVESFIERGHSWTILANGVPVALVGISINWAGESADVWGITSDAMSGHAIPITLQLRRALNKASDYGIHRLALQVQSTYPEGIRWAKVLGFQPEVLLQKWGPRGTDYLQLVRLY